MFEGAIELTWHIAARHLVLVVRVFGGQMASRRKMLVQRMLGSACCDELKERRGH